VSNNERTQQSVPGAVTETSSVAPSRISSASFQQAGRTFWILWRVCSAILLFSVLLVIYAAGWEYSTRRYLKGFSDAIVPVNLKPAGQIQAILRWMSGPAAEDTSPSKISHNRNPDDTLNYSSLLKVCGTATNAFINLADSSGLRARRLLLLDSNRTTVHVVAEVLIRGRWIVVDPVFRYIPRGPDGSLLTSEQLADPTTFSHATRNVPNYPAAYNYQLTSHVHLGRIPYVGRPLHRLLHAAAPAWASSWEISLVLERSSLALLMLSILLLVAVLIVRIGLRWYAGARLNLRPPHLHTRFARAAAAFFGVAE
jgi:hypothetical protein